MGPGSLSMVAGFDVYDCEVRDTARRQRGQMLANLGFTANDCDVPSTLHTLAIKHRAV